MPVMIKDADFNLSQLSYLEPFHGFCLNS